MGQPELDDPRLTVVGLFMEAHEGLTAKFSARFNGHDLSETEFEVLLRLARTPGRRLRMGDLSDQTSLSTSGITRVVDRLERDGQQRPVALVVDRGQREDDFDRGVGDQLQLAKLVGSQESFGVAYRLLLDGPQTCSLIVREIEFVLPSEEASRTLGIVL